jgi:hypothetical protein
VVIERLLCAVGSAGGRGAMTFTIKVEVKVALACQAPVRCRAVMLLAKLRSEVTLSRE